MSNPTKTPLSTDWLSTVDQQSWFEQFNQGEGLRFNHFQEFLDKTVYYYFAQIPDKNVNLQNSNDTASSKSNSKFTYQQEIQLFKIFDFKNDHLIDRDEFSRLCQDWLHGTFRRSCALIIVDVQNDFIDGSLALIDGPAGEDGADVVPIINNLLEKYKFALVAYTLDWHPPDHIGFHENLHLRKYQLKKDKQEDITKSLPDNSTGGINHNNGVKDEQGFVLKKLINKANVFDTVMFDDGRMEQKLWPVHCIQNSWGAQLHPDLKQVPSSIRVHKGALAHVDAYSAFWDNMRLNETGLRQELVSRKISDVFVCGLALDYCVSASAIDSIKAGFVTFVIEDACRGIDRGEIERRKSEMLAKGIMIVNSATVEKYLDKSTDTENFNEQLNDNMTKISFNGSGDETSSNDGNNIHKSLKNLDRTLVMEICIKRALVITNPSC